MFSDVSYDVSTAVFEGPFDLLLHLILREQVDIHEVSLSTIVDAYLTEIEKMQELDLDIATEFLLIASTLVELKARRLLPGKENIDLDEEFALWEERDLLLARLLECKTFKDVSLVFQQLADLADRAFPRTTGPDERFSGLLPDLMEGVTPQKLHKAILKALAPKPEPHIDLFHVAPVRLSVSEAVSELMSSLPNADPPPLITQPRRVRAMRGPLISGMKSGSRWSWRCSVCELIPIIISTSSQMSSGGQALRRYGHLSRSIAVGEAIPVNFAPSST